MFGLINQKPNNKSITQEALSLIPSYYNFKNWYNFLNKSQWWSREQLEEYQLSKLNKLLIHAYENVPYYKQMFNNLGLKPKDIQDFKDLQKLPYLTKDIIRNNLSELKARNYSDKKFEYMTTGGSTGAPLGLFYEKGFSKSTEWAFIKKLWDRVDYKFIDKCVILHGNVVNSISESIFWETSLFGRWLILSSYHMSDRNLPFYIKKIKNFKPKFIQAYPSLITILARYMKKYNILPFKSVKAILCGSENIYSWQKNLIKEIFQCKIYSWYGQTERVVLGGVCKENEGYHLFPEYGITELIGKNEKPIKEEGGVGVIVGTGLTNYVMPLIRYKTDDIGVHTNEKCNCHREYPILKNVEGRLQEYIITKNNKLISVTALEWHPSFYDNAKQIQFYQDKKGELILKIVKDKNYSNKDTNLIKDMLNRRLGDDIHLTIQFVDNIPPTKNGKYRIFIQKLPIEFEKF